MIPIFSALQALQQNPMLDPNIEVPSTTIERPADLGVAAHTNHMILKGPWKGNNIYDLEANIGSRVFAPAGYGPSSIRAAYNLASTGGSGAHAVVIAYHYPNALRDFNIFATQFSLPKETSTSLTASTNKVFQVVYQGSSAPGQNTGWNQEAALDIEWSHSMAPGAKIYLVEANSASMADLNAAIKKAAALPDVRSVSMSFGATEFGGETLYENDFAQPGVVFFASTGDSGGQHSWPALSPSVVAVGGTTLKGSGTSWTETVWSGSGGGISSYFPRPTFQDTVKTVVGTKRGGPDISAVADPNTGVAVYAPTTATTSAWMVFGGTSVSCPLMAGIYNSTGLKSASSSPELTRIYANLGTASFRDIVSGKSGSNSAKAGYDLASGVGSPLGISGF